MPRRRHNKAPIKQPYWKQDGKQWYADRESLERAVRDSGSTESELRSKMGQGYFSLQSALEGARVDGWTAHFIESMLEPVDPRPK